MCNNNNNNNAFVYIMANCNRILADSIALNGLRPNDNYTGIILYVGVTAKLYQRVNQHKQNILNALTPSSLGRDSLRSNSCASRRIPDQVRNDGDNNGIPHGYDTTDNTIAFDNTPVAFTKYYHCNKLVYFEQLPNITDAIKREKQLKNWKRQWKLKLITDFNPKWNDLFYNLSTLL